MIDGPLSDVNRNEIASTFQIGNEGISRDYTNFFMMINMNCKTLLNKPNFKLANSIYTPEKLRIKILNSLKTLPSYTEYMTRKGQINGLGLIDFLTKRGREIVARLDEIVIELKRLNVKNPKALDIDHIFTLIEEQYNLII